MTKMFDHFFEHVIITIKFHHFDSHCNVIFLINIYKILKFLKIFPQNFDKTGLIGFDRTFDWLDRSTRWVHINFFYFFNARKGG